MVPLLSGESYHIGYEPLTEDLAFSRPVTVSSFDSSKVTGFMVGALPIRIPRGKIPCDRIVQLIHKFINCTNGAEIIMPKYHIVPDVKTVMPMRAIYYAKLRYALFGGDTAFLTIHVQACKSRDGEYVEVSIDYNRGMRSIVGLFSDNLRVYLESDGSVFNRVRAQDRRGILATGYDIMAEDTGDTGYVHHQIKKYSAIDECIHSVFDAPKLSLMMPEPEPEPEEDPVVLPKPKLSRDSATGESLNQYNVNCQEIDDAFSISGIVLDTPYSIDPLNDNHNMTG